MTLAEVRESCRQLLEIRQSERERLDLIHRYLRDDPEGRRLPGLPSDAPDDVVRLARFARVNLLKYVVGSRVQQMYVKGFQTPDSPDDLQVWKQCWQANQLDARQIGVHRATVSFGAAYETVLPGTQAPVIRGWSPRQMTVAYGDDDEWPELGLHPMHQPGRFRLLDEECAYLISSDGSPDGDIELVEVSKPHGMRWLGEPVCPIVRFTDTSDLDDPCRGIIQPLLPLQDQVNATTFGLMVAQHFGAFRQRVILGWVAKSEAELFRASAATVFALEDAPGDVEVKDLPQTDLRGYIESREASIRHMATVSQTPVHELLGEMINLSAEALEAARAGANAAAEENRTVVGESHERVLGVAAEYLGLDVDPSAEVVWQDTRLHSLEEIVTAWGAAVQQLGIPPQEVVDELPLPQHKKERIKAAMGQVDTITQLMGTLDRQAQPVA